MIPTAKPKRKPKTVSDPDRRAVLKYLAKGAVLTVNLAAELFRWSKNKARDVLEALVRENLLERNETKQPWSWGDQELRSSFSMHCQRKIVQYRLI